MCDICVETFNKSTRKPVTCEFCEFVCCRTCAEKYVLDVNEAKCMDPSCQKVWSRKHIRSVFQLKFIKGQFAEHQGEFLFQREQALLPETQKEIERVNAIRDQIIDLIREIDRLRDFGSEILKEISDKYPLDSEEYSKELSEQYSPITTMMNQHNQTIVELNTMISEKPNRTESKFVKACPTEDCRGFLNDEFNCGLCHIQYCKECHQQKMTDHVCNKDDIATVSFMAKDTKPCPKCGEGIYKIDGCDQMWCTSCHTAFSWNTGTIETNIHNPHYYEYMRQIGGGQAPRNRGDIPCGRVLDHTLCHQLCDEYHRIAGFNQEHYNKESTEKCIKTFLLLIKNDIISNVSDIVPYIMKTIKKLDYEPMFDEFPVKQTLEQFCFVSVRNFIEKHGPLTVSQIIEKYKKQNEFRIALSTMYVKVQNMIIGGIHTNAHIPEVQIWTENRFEYLRRNYLLNYISKKDFVNALVSDNLEILYRQEMNDLLTMGTDTFREIMYRYLDSLTYISHISEIDDLSEISIIPEIERLIYYINDNLYDICHAYSKTTIAINDEFRLLNATDSKHYLNYISQNCIPTDVSESYKKMLQRRRNRNLKKEDNQR